MSYRERRLAKGYSMVMLAYAAGVSEHTVLRLEKGKNISPENLKRIEEALDEPSQIS